MPLTVWRIQQAGQTMPALARHHQQTYHSSDTDGSIPGPEKAASEN